MKNKIKIAKYLLYGVIVGGCIVGVFWFLTFLFSVSFLDSNYKLGENVVDMLGLPKSIG